MTIPFVQPGVWPDIGPRAFASRIGRHDRARIAILGIPDDAGVRMNHGTPGAAHGPTAFRAALAKYGAADPHGWSWPSVVDVGDVIPADDLHETHNRVTSAAGELLDRGLIPVAIGGGHDLTFPFVRAAAERGGPMAGIYLDAHLDVRPEDGSGMPFRRLIEVCGVERLDVVGFSPLVNSAEHVRWFTGHGGHIDAIAPESDWVGSRLFVSIDLDSIDAAQAPGVSARNPSGLSVAEASRWALAAGRCQRVACFDLMELCPPNDEHGRTARVAAHLFLCFLRGAAERPGIGA
jgi:arginase family enzyme